MLFRKRKIEKEDNIILNKPYSKIESFWLDVETEKIVKEICKNKKISKGDFYRNSVKINIKNLLK